MFDILRYTAADAAKWNSFVAASKNGTFLLDRKYMDYHSDRFSDHSLIVADPAGHVIALLPANRIDDQVFSHGGLTYGGLILNEEMTTTRMVDLLNALSGYLSAAGISRLEYKTIPSIYHRLPAEEDKFALFVLGAELSRRDVLSVVDLASPGPIQQRRMRGARKAEKTGVSIEASDAWPAFWVILAENLAERHGRQPVHSVDEIILLHRRFPENIRLYVAKYRDTVIAGAVLYLVGRTAHVQYIGSSREGRETGALDMLFIELLHSHRDYRYFDFGVSNEGNGRILNRGLCEFKDGFGARAIVHDHYSLATKTV